MKSISLGHLSSDMFVDVGDYLFDFCCCTLYKIISCGGGRVIQGK